MEYALETVRAGSTVLGLRCSEGVVLANEVVYHTKLQNPNFLWKLFQIDDHIGTASSGLNSDARILVDNARIYAQVVRLSYDEAVGVEMIAKRVGDIMQMYTQHAGVRPFGAALLIGGVDKTGGRVYLADPSGMYWEYNAWAIGKGAEKAKEYLEKNYREDMKLEDAIEVSVFALVHSVEKMTEGWTVNVATIPLDTKRFSMLSAEDTQRYLDKALEERGKKAPGGK